MSTVQLPIIVYHSIDDYHTLLSTTRARFEQQVRFLARRGYQSIRLGEVVRLLRANRPLPRRSCVLTFDDAMPSVLETARPILAEHGMFGTVFVVTGQTGERPEWYRLRQEYRQRPLLDRQALETLAGDGWEMQPHTHDHPVLSHLPLEQQVEQISMSRDRIQDWFGTDGRILAYPFGQFNDTTRQAMAESGMDAGLTLRFSIHLSSDDWFNWPRLGSAWFKGSNWRQRLAMAGVLEWYVRLKHRVRGDRSRHFQHPTPETTRGLTATAASPGSTVSASASQ